MSVQPGGNFYRGVTSELPAVEFHGKIAFLYDQICHFGEKVFSIYALILVTTVRMI